MNQVFVSVFGETIEAFQTMIQNSIKYTDHIEVRFDLCGSWKHEVNIKNMFPSNITVLLTDRSTLISPNEHARSFDLIDIDIKDVTSKTNTSKKHTVLSAHLFDTFSITNIENTIAALQKHSARYYKIAAMIHSDQDLWSFYQATQHLNRNHWILMGMGPYGKISRALFAQAGFSTFACLPNQSVAPGQINIVQLKHLLS